MHNLLRTDTPTQLALVDVADAPNTATRTQFGVSDRSAQGQHHFQEDINDDAVVLRHWTTHLLHAGSSWRRCMATGGGSRYA
jgi:hypothetical protein